MAYFHSYETGQSPFEVCNKIMDTDKFQVGEYCYHYKMDYGNVLSNKMLCVLCISNIQTFSCFEGKPCIVWKLKQP